MGIGNAKPDTSPAHRCITHRDRFAAVKTKAGGQCWECYLGPEKFALRFPQDFYDQEKTADDIGELK